MVAGSIEEALQLQIELEARDRDGRTTEGGRSGASVIIPPPSESPPACSMELAKSFDRQRSRPIGIPSGRSAAIPSRSRHINPHSHASCCRPELTGTLHMGHRSAHTHGRLTFSPHAG